MVGDDGGAAPARKRSASIASDPGASRPPSSMGGAGSPGLGDSFASLSVGSPTSAVMSPLTPRQPVEGKAASLFRMAQLRARHERTQQLLEGPSTVTKRAQNRDRSVPAIQEVTATLRDRAKQRFEDGVRYLQMQRRMKPPPPMSMDELEQHPLTRNNKAKRRRAQQQQQQQQQSQDGSASQKKDAKTDNASSDSDDSAEGHREKLPFIPDPVRKEHVKLRIQQELGETAAMITLQSNFSPKNAVVVGKSELLQRGPSSNSKAGVSLGGNKSATGDGRPSVHIALTGDDCESIDWGAAIRPSARSGAAGALVTGGQTGSERSLRPGAVASLKPQLIDASACSSPAGTPRGQPKKTASMLTASQQSQPLALPSIPPSPRSLANSATVPLNPRLQRSRSLSIGSDISSGSCSSSDAFPESLLRKKRASLDVKSVESDDGDSDNGGRRSNASNASNASSSAAFITQTGEVTATSPRRLVSGDARSSTGSTGSAMDGPRVMSRRASSLRGSDIRRRSSVRKLSTLRASSKTRLMGGGGGGAAPLGEGPADEKSLRELALGKPDSIFERDPEDFLRIRGEDKHAQSYKKGTFSPKLSVGGSKDPRSKEGFASADVEYFLGVMKQRDHEFNVATLLEFERARNAQTTFRGLKAAQLDAMLSDQHLQSAPMEKIIAIARRRVRAAASRKDHDERLDVFFEHTDQIEDHFRAIFTEADWGRVEKCLVAVRKIVRKTNGHQGEQEFTKIARKFFRPEQFFLTHIVELFSLLAPMFGLNADQYTAWHRSRVGKFTGYDYEEKFREHDKAIPHRDLTTEVRFRLTPHALRGIHLEEDEKPEFRIAVSVERHKFVTGVCVNPRPDWRESFVVHIYNSQSPVHVTVLCGEEEIGHGTFNVSRFSSNAVAAAAAASSATGSSASHHGGGSGTGKARMWVPCPGSDGSHLHAKVNIGIDILPLPKSSTASSAAAANSSAAKAFLNDPSAPVLLPLALGGGRIPKPPAPSAGSSHHGSVATAAASDGPQTARVQRGGFATTAPRGENGAAKTARGGDGQLRATFL